MVCNQFKRCAHAPVSYTHLFDNRSFRLNDEANLNIYDAVFAAEQVTAFERDKSVSRLMTPADFKNRSTPRKLFDGVAGILRQQL